MDEKEKQEIALFRYGIIAPVLNSHVGGQVKYFREIAAQALDVPGLGKRVYLPATFKSWLKRYRCKGFDGLVPKLRDDRGQSRKIDPGLAEEINKMLAAHPFVSGAALYRLLVSGGIVRPGDISEGTLRKFIRDNQLREKQAPDPRKKFEKEHVNELWTADCLHGPYLKLPGLERKHQVFLIAAIDDHSRVITARGWFRNENSIALEIILKDAIRKFGLPHAIYCDNGSIFSSSHLQLACARLGIALIHSKPYDSPSRGKIERFFRTVRDKFISILDLNEIADLEQLNQRFEAWLEKEYHKHFHGGIGQTPMERFMNDLSATPMRRVPDEELNHAFEVTIQRVVKNDATVSVGNILYECPPAFIGRKIEIRHPSGNPENLAVYQHGKSVCALKKVNIHENANVPAWAIRFSAPGESEND